MPQTMKFEGADGAVMWVEVAPGTGSSIGLVADESGAAKAATRLEDSLESVRGAAVALMETLGRLQDDPRGAEKAGIRLDEVTLELGLSFGVEGGMIVAKGSARAESSVALTWRRPS